jgi:hypothetical protein
VHTLLCCVFVPLCPEVFALVDLSPLAPLVPNDLLVAPVRASTPLQKPLAKRRLLTIPHLLVIVRARIYGR